MSINGKKIIGAFLGATIAGDTGDDGYEVMPSVAGAAVGATIGNYLDTSMPNQIFSEIGTEASVEGSTVKKKTTRQRLVEDIENELTNNIADEENLVFDHKNPLSTITKDNYKDAMSYYSKLDNDQLKDHLLKIKTNQENPYIPLADLSGEFRINPYAPEKVLVSDIAELEEKKTAMRAYLIDVKNETEEFANRRVAELEPLLKKTEGYIKLEDGKLSTRIEGEKVDLHLTTTLNDDITHGYSSNNNAYLARKFNVLGGLIAEGRGKEENLSLIAEKLGLKEGTESYRSLENMLIKKDGVSKEAALGFLADIGVKGKALANAVSTFEDTKQWDEESTALLYHPEKKYTTEYAKSTSNSVSAEYTVRFKKGTLDLNLDGDKGLRALGTVAHDANSRSEVNFFKGALLEEGFDFFSHTKADANVVYSSLSTDTRMPSMFVPFNRNANTVTNRAVGAPDINPNRKTAYDEAFDYFRDTFKGNTTMSSAVALRAETFDMEKSGDLLSEAMGSNITLADGYSIANKNNMARFESSGQDVVKIKSDYQGNVVANNPLVRKLIEGDVDLTSLQLKAKSNESFYANSKERSRVNGVLEHFSSTLEDVDNSSSFYESVAKFKDTKRFRNLANNIIDLTEEDIKRHGITTEKEKLETFKRNVLRGLRDNSQMSLPSSIEGSIGNYFNTVRDEYNATANDIVNKITDGNHSEARDLINIARQKYAEAWKEASESSSLISPRGGSVVGYDSDGSPQKISRTFSNYSLEDIQTRVGDNGVSSLEMRYNGTLNLGDNFVGKGFSINAKEQFGNLSKEDFGYSGVILDLHKKGYLTNHNNGKITVAGTMLESGKDTVVPTKGLLSFLQNRNNFNEEGRDQLNNLSRHFQNSVDMISDNSNTGFKNEFKIELDLINKEKKSKYLTDTVWNSLLNYKDKFDIKDNQGLVDFGLATTNEKASLATLANTVINNKVRFEKMNTDYTVHKALDEDAVRNRFSQLVPNFTSNKTGQALIEEMRKKMEEYHIKASDMFGTKGGVYDMLSKEEAREEAIGFFNNSYNFVKDYKRTRVNISALNRTALTETGAGKTEKKMSWNAQSQLLSNGYTHEELNMLGKFSQGAHNDLVAITGMIDHHNDSINSQINNKNLTSFKNSFNSVVEERRDMMKSIGIDTEKNVDFYNLSYTPKGSFKSIPIIYDESKIFDSYSHRLTGNQTNKRAISLMYDIINLDKELENTSDLVTAKSIQSELDKRHSQLQGHLSSSLGGSSNIAKAAFTREAESSVQSTVGAVNGSITEFLENERNNGRHGSYVSVSEEGLNKRLKLAGLSLKDVEIEEVGEGLSKVKVKSDGLPFFGLVNREPATGPMSVRMSEYLVDTTIKGKGSADSLFIKSEDNFYKYFQFGDYDFDNVTEYFPKDRKNIDSKDLANFHEKGVNLAKDYDDLKAFAEKLGVKNNKSDKMASLFEVFEKNAKNINTESDWHEHYLNYLNKTTTQAGYRKIVSAPVTMLSASLNNSLLQSATDVSSQSTQASRVLTHYFVENLLKAQHASGDENANATVAEVLSSLRKNSFKDGSIDAGARDKYLTHLRDNLNDMLSNHEDEDLKALGQNAVDNIVKAEKVYMTETPTNPMDLGSAGVNKEFDERVRNLRKTALEGEDQAEPIFKRLKVATDIETKAKVGYDRFIKASEHFITNNKKAIGLGAVGLAGISMAFRSTASTDVGRDTLAPNVIKEERRPPQGRSFTGENVHLTPHREANKSSVTVEGDYINSRDSMRENTRRSILGEGIDSAQIEYRE